MVGTAKMLGAALRLTDHSRSMMATNIVEASYNAVMAYKEQNRFSGNLGRDVLARLAKLLRACDQLP